MEGSNPVNVTGTGSRSDIQHNNIQDNDSQHNDIQDNDSQHNDIQDNDSQHNDIQDNDSQHNDIQHNNRKMQLPAKWHLMLILSAIMLSVCYTESHN